MKLWMSLVARGICKASDALAPKNPYPPDSQEALAWEFKELRRKYGGRKRK